MTTAAKLAQYRRELEEHGFTPDLVHLLVMKAAEDLYAWDGRGPSPLTVDETPKESNPEAAGRAVRKEIDAARKVADELLETSDRMSLLETRTRSYPVLRQEIADAQEIVDLLRQIHAKGLRGPALAALTDGAPTARLRAYAAESREMLSEYGRLFDARKGLLQDPM